LKIAILSCFYPYRGGISQFNAALSEELRKVHEVKAFNFIQQYPSILFPGKTQYVTPDDEAVPVESERILDSINPISYVKTVKAISKWSPDVVIVRYWMSWFAPSLGYVTRQLRKKGIKVISILDNVIPHEQHFFDTPLTKYFLSGSDACITLCDAVREDLRRINPDIPCCVIQHPLYSHFGEKLSSKDALEALGLKDGNKTLLFFGLIRKYKGLDILLDAFKELPDDYQLIIAGEPYGDFTPYQELIDGIKDKKIHLALNYIKDSEVKKYFSGADLCVLPYRSATQSGVSAISFHFDVPMAVTDTGGLKKDIVDSGTGVLCPSCKSEDVKKTIEEFFSNPSISANCKNAIAIQKQLLSWENFSSHLIDFINGIKK